ncbi:MAG: AAA family ATPase, partial [Planctomycetota bacterium]
HLLDEFPGETEVALLSNVQGGRGELLEWILMAFGQPYDGGHVARFQRLEQFLIKRYSEGARLTIIIDEAHNVSVEQLEELRLLSNINSGGDLLLQIILVGQPELRDLLARPDLRQFVQRITADFDLTALQDEDISHYIQHRLKVAGCERVLFPEETCQLIAHVTRGIPRLINIFCDLCLVYGYASDASVIDRATLHRLLLDMEKNAIFRQFTPLSSAPTLVADKDKSNNKSKKGDKGSAANTAPAPDPRPHQEGRDDG